MRLNEKLNKTVYASVEDALRDIQGNAEESGEVYTVEIQQPEQPKPRTKTAPVGQGSVQERMNQITQKIQQDMCCMLQRLQQVELQNKKMREGLDCLCKTVQGFEAQNREFKECQQWVTKAVNEIISSLQAPQTEFVDYRPVVNT